MHQGLLFVTITHQETITRVNLIPGLHGRSKNDLMYEGDLSTDSINVCDDCWDMPEV
jgi:hypothetical protein